MSRSYRRPANKEKSSKKDKTIGNRKFRKVTKMAIRNMRYEYIPHKIHQCSDVWNWGSDGLQFGVDYNQDPEIVAYLMRK